jgi:hypothetical protein
MKRGVKILLSLSVVALLQPMFISTASGGDCYTDCVTRYECYSSHPFAGSDCYSLCRDAGRPDGWGAIAYSAKEKVSGWSFALGDKHTAEQVATQYCARQHGSNCVIEASYYESCGAVAADGELVAWGTSDTKAQAEQRALAECAKIGGKGCVVEVSACSARNGTTTLAPAGPPPAPKATSWGAIAYSTRDMGAGWSRGKGDRASAEKEAMSVCSQRGKECVLRTAFNKQCGALAADRDFAGWGTSTDQREAMQKAIADCKKAGGTNCVLHIMFCSN